MLGIISVLPISLLFSILFINSGSIYGEVDIIDINNKLPLYYNPSIMSENAQADIIQIAFNWSCNGNPETEREIEWYKRNC